MIKGTIIEWRIRQGNCGKTRAIDGPWMHLILCLHLLIFLNLLVHSFSLQPGTEKVGMISWVLLRSTHLTVYACSHVRLAHALFGPGINNPRKESLLAQPGTGINLDQSTAAGGRTTLYLLPVAPFLCVRRINVSWKSFIHMRCFPSLHDISLLLNQDYLASSRHFLFAFHFCLACRYFSWFGKEHGAQYGQEESAWVSNWEQISSGLFSGAQWCSSSFS